MMFAEAAASIGRRMAVTAEWTRGTCTWRITRSSPRAEDAGRVVVEAAGPYLYQGTAGIGLFLGELFGQQRDPTIRVTAEGALRYATRCCHDISPTAFGFYAGRVGVAYALARYAGISQLDEFAHLARRVMAPLVGREHDCTNHDFIGGASGAIPAMLTLSDWLAAPEIRTSAEQLGVQLAHAASRRHDGWAWGARNVQALPLTGVAHGASGYAHAFVELYAATHEPAYRYIAQQALLYEHERFDARAGNWPDYRDAELMQAMASPDREQAVRTLAYERAPDILTQPTFMTAWCHGAPGIGLARLRALEVLQDKMLGEDVEAAIAITLRDLAQPTMNYSLCHGIMGNLETLVTAASSLGRPALRVKAEAIAAAGIEQFEALNRDWPSGAPYGARDPSLLVGDAGIGHQLLRLSGASIPSVLLPLGPPHNGAIPRRRTSMNTRRAAPSAIALWRLHASDYFDRSIRIINRLQKAGDVHESAVPSNRIPAPRAVFDLLTTLIADPSLGDIAGLIRDATAVDRARYAQAVAFTDHREPLVTLLTKHPCDDIAWDTTHFAIAPHVALACEEYDWDRWLTHSVFAFPDRLTRPSHFVICVDGLTVVSRRIGGMSYRLLAAANNPIVLASLLDAIACGSAVDERETVLRELHAAYVAGLIRRC